MLAQWVASCCSLARTVCGHYYTDYRACKVTVVQHHSHHLFEERKFLCSQVSKVVKSIANVLKFRTACFTSVSDMDSEQRKLRLGTDVLVATPGRLLALLNRNEVSLQRTQVLVLDEADVLFLDQSFPLQPIGAACADNTQFIFTTATLPDIVVDQIKSEFPEADLLTGPGLHRIAPTIEEILVDCTGPPTQQRSPETAFENKRLALLRALEYRSDRTLIFCNTISQCRNVENALQRADRHGKVRSVLAYHGAIDGEKRQEAVMDFSKKLLKTPMVMVCTDRASRGMDFNAAPVLVAIVADIACDWSCCRWTTSSCSTSRRNRAST